MPERPISRRTRALRVAALAAVAVLAALAIGPASATHHGPPRRTERMYSAPLPCAIACPYWTDDVDLLPRACAPEPLVPRPTYDEERIVVPEVVEGARPFGLYWWAYPNGDRDMFVCIVHDAGTPEERWEEIPVVPCLGCGECDYDAVLLGCSEFGFVPAEPDQVLVLRVYNWLDWQPAYGFYEWIT